VRIPVLEVYALTALYGGQIDPSKFDRPTGTVRNIPPGNNKKVMVDITGIIKKYLENASSNYGLIIGGLEGLSNGTFSWKSNSFPSGKAAKITFHYDNRKK
jgi:hypothetical protein